MGDYVSAILVISSKRVFLALPEHIKALSGQNFRLPDGSYGPGKPWIAVCIAADLFALIQLSISLKEPLGFTVSTVLFCLFFFSNNYLFNRSKIRDLKGT